MVIKNDAQLLGNGLQAEVLPINYNKIFTVQYQNDLFTFHPLTIIYPTIILFYLI